MGERLPYDDPYTMLAYTLIAYLSPSELDRVLEDNEFVYHMIQKEVRNQDLIGPFTDALVTTILEEKRRMELMHELDKLADYFYWKELDLKKLREKIISICKKYNIM